MAACSEDFLCGDDFDDVLAISPSYLLFILFLSKNIFSSLLYQ